MTDPVSAQSDCQSTRSLVDRCSECGDWVREHPDGYHECLQCGVRATDQVIPAGETP